MKSKITLHHGPLWSYVWDFEPSNWIAAVESLRHVFTYKPRKAIPLGALVRLNPRLFV